MYDRIRGSKAQIPPTENRCTYTAGTSMKVSWYQDVQAVCQQICMPAGCMLTTVLRRACDRPSICVALSTVAVRFSTSRRSIRLPIAFSFLASFRVLTPLDRPAQVPPVLVTDRVSPTVIELVGCPMFAKKKIYWCRPYLACQTLTMHSPYIT
jgi:hypothetical protein